MDKTLIVFLGLTTNQLASRISEPSTVFGRLGPWLLLRFGVLGVFFLGFQVPNLRMWPWMSISNGFSFPSWGSRGFFARFSHAFGTLREDEWNGATQHQGAWHSQTSCLSIFCWIVKWTYFSGVQETWNRITPYICQTPKQPGFCSLLPVLLSIGGFCSTFLNMPLTCVRKV